jgi:hypothetical protein
MEGSRMISTSPKPYKPLQRTCKNRACRNKFTPTERHPFAVACCTGCEIILAKRNIEKAQAARAKKERKETAVRKVAVKTRSDWVKEAQIAFNAYIRGRDKGSPCICCGEPLESGNIGGAFDCGHYRSVGSAPHLRFDERNAHGQRKQCNRYGAGRAVDYRVGLIARLGVEAVESLESNQEPRKWSIDDLKAIKAEYKAKLKALVMDKGVAE